MINLVWDDTRPATDSVYLELRHNAMGEVEGNGRYVVSDTGLASFRIADLVPEGEESIDIKLKSNMDRKDGVGEYIETEKYHTEHIRPAARPRHTSSAASSTLPKTTLLLLGIR